MKKDNLLINVSGGRSSAMMAYHISTSPMYASFNKLFLFCNTGQERKETLDFLNNMVIYWGLDIHFIEGIYSSEKGQGPKGLRVDFDVLDKNSRIFSNAIAHLQKNRWVGVPNQATPYCSVYLKVRPANWYAKKFFGTVKFKSAIGFRQEDMPRRISFAEISANEKNIFPLITDYARPVNNQDLDEFFKTQPFKLEISGDLGNCRYCWKKPDEKIVKNILLDLEKGDTELIDWYYSMEKFYNNTFFRKKRSILDLVQLAELPRNGIIDFPSDTMEDGCICTI